ncbi:MAG: hypothetical protein ACJ71L_12750, partial [Nitrososphaeraceae archaeon]
FRHFHLRGDVIIVVSDRYIRIFNASIALRDQLKSIERDYYFFDKWQIKYTILYSWQERRNKNGSL